MRWILIVPVLLYRWLVSPWKPRMCRFEPTCSQYAIDALRTHGAVRGAWLTVHRLARCQPFCQHGYDPVPPRRTTRPAAPAASQPDRRGV